MTDFSAAAAPITADTSGLLGTPLSALIARAPLCLPPDASIQMGAQAMRDAGVSSVLLMQGAQLCGIVTDRDLRNRVVAQGLSPALPLRQIASTALHSLPPQASALDALTLMAQHNIHHVPVLDQARVLGIVTPRNVDARQSPSVVQLARGIHKAPDIATLAQLSAQVPALQQALVHGGAGAQGIGRIVTTVTDAITTRLIALAEQQLGPAPVPWVWVAAGSQARQEQTARTDQDNALVLADEYDPVQHGAYFADFARFVCDGLDACGYIHCPGEMMAMNAQWCQPLAQWRRYFRKWIDQPEPMALLHSSVFFDLRAVAGHTPLLTQLRQEELSHAQRSQLFLGHMVGNALTQRPPLNWLGNIRPLRGPAHAGCIDLKHSAIAPMVDLARIYALAGGLEAVNTQERLAQAGALAGGEVSAAAAQDLGDALAFIAAVRLVHQARQADAQQPPDNFLPLAKLSRFERLQLKQAFKLIQAQQAVLAKRYPISR